MFDSGILDMAIGMIVVFLQASLICTAVCELIAAVLKSRAKYLEAGILKLLGSHTISERFYSHPIIQGLSPDGQKPSYITSRAFATTLLDMLAPGVTSENNPTEKASSVIEKLRGHLRPKGSNQDPVDDPSSAAGQSEMAGREADDSNFETDGDTAQISKSLLALIGNAEQGVDHMRANIEGWFNDSMDRVSGYYKRNTQYSLIIIGLIVSILLNIDTVEIAQSLQRDKALRDSLVAVAPQLLEKQNAPGAGQQATGGQQPGTTGAAGTPGAGETSSDTSTQSDSTSDQSLKKKAEDLRESVRTLYDFGLPIGWYKKPPAGDAKPDAAKGEIPANQIPRSLSDAWSLFQMHWLGWFLTALAVSLGSPFWFDLLNKFMVVRSTIKPREKSPEDKSKD